MKTTSHKPLAKNQNNPRIVFFGTPKLGATVLEELIANSQSPIAVVTREDKPAGRGQRVSLPPVKIVAQKHKIPVFQPPKLKENQDFFGKLRSLKPNLGVVAAYGRIIPKEVLEIFPKGILNVHPSLLPRYRGASPIQSAILEGEKETGVTIILLDEELDHGPILAQEILKIDKDDTQETLIQKLGQMGAKILVKVIPSWLSGKIKPKEQDHKKAILTKMLTKEDGYIDLEKTPNPEKFQLMIRAFYPWPGVWTQVNGKVIKFLPGNLIQPEGKKSIDVRNFLNNYPEGAKLVEKLGLVKFLH